MELKYLHLSPPSPSLFWHQARRHCVQMGMYTELNLALTHLSLPLGQNSQWSLEYHPSSVLYAKGQEDHYKIPALHMAAPGAAHLRERVIAGGSMTCGQSLGIA